MKYQNYREFYSIEEATEWGTLHFGDWMPEHQANGWGCSAIDDPCSHALVMYLGHYHRAINNELRNYYHLQYMDLGRDSRERRHLDAQRICKVISQRTIPDDIILYRFIDCIQNFRSMLFDGQKKLRVGSLMVDKGFMSTSLVYKTLKKEIDGKVLMRLLCPKGFTGAYVNLISKRQNEQEVLLLPNSQFVVRKIYRNLDGKIVFDCNLILPAGCHH